MPASGRRQVSRDEVGEPRQQPPGARLEQARLAAKARRALEQMAVDVELQLRDGGVPIRTGREPR